MNVHLLLVLTLVSGTSKRRGQYVDKYHYYNEDTNGRVVPENTSMIKDVAGGHLFPLNLPPTLHIVLLLAGDPLH